MLATLDYGFKYDSSLSLINGDSSFRRLRLGRCRSI